MISRRQHLELRLRNLNSAIEALERGSSVSKGTRPQDVCKLLYQEQAAVHQELAQDELESRSLVGATRVKRAVLIERLRAVRNGLRNLTRLSLTYEERTRRFAVLTAEATHLTDSLRALDS